LIDERPNGLPFSGAALLDWESSRAASSFQNRLDLARREAASAATAGWVAAGLEHSQGMNTYLS
jgi:hypothetical protein